MDGVLLDAREWHYDALNIALRHFGFEIDRQSHLDTFDGLSTMQKLRLLHEENGLPKGLFKLINDLKQVYTIEYIATKARSNFAHRYALNKLKLNGYTIGLATNSIRQTTEAAMQKTQLFDYFDSIVTNEDIKNPKPEPDIYIEVMRRLNVSPEECLVVEDNPRGVKAAIAAGANVLKVRDTEEVHYLAIQQKIDELENN